MPGEPNYYAILGLTSTATAEAIEAAYRSRLLPFRVGQLRQRSAASDGPDIADIEQAYAVLGNAGRRAAYDAEYFPTKEPVARRSRFPAWLAALATLCILALCLLGYLGLRGRNTTDPGVVSQPAQTPPRSIVAGSERTVTIAASQAGQAVSSPTVPIATASSTGAVTVVPSSTIPPATAVPTVIPTTTPTVTRAAPTNTALPMVTPTPTTVPPTVPPTATEPPPPEPEPEPEPTVAPPPFPATDRIGTAQSVNLRSGPGVGYGVVGLLPTGTLLQATGEQAYAGGQLWRRFRLQDGRIGWVRDLDVLPVRS